MSNLFSPYSLMILLPILLRIKKLSEKNVIGTQHQVYSYGLCPYTGPPFFLLLWMNILHSLKISAFSLMHLSMPSYLLNINIVEHLASWIFLFSPDKHTNYAIFPQLKKKKNLILTLLTLLALSHLSLLLFAEKHFKVYLTIQH